MKLDIQLFAASKSTTFSESNINASNNTSSLTINIWFSANNSTTWFQSATLYCTCNGSTQSTTVSHAKGGSSSASFTFNNIAHNNDGTKSVSWSWSCATGTTVLGTIGDSGTKTLTSIPRKATIKTANDFNDEQDPSMTFENKGGFTMNVWLEPNPNGEHLCIRNNIPNTGSYVWTLTPEERTQLRQACTNPSCKVRYGLYTNINGTLYASYVDKTMTIVNGNPIFSDFTAVDVNNTTITLTDDNTINVNGYSNVRATISTANKAVAQKEATMSKYRFVIGNQKIDIAYDDENAVTGLINNAENGIYNVYAIDSRGNTTLVTKLASSELAYTPITLDIDKCSVERDNNNSADTAKLKFQGSFWKQSFGLTTNNIQSITYQYKKTTDTTWLTGTTTITPTINNDGTFEFNGNIESQNSDGKWDLQSAYDVKISISDYLSTAQLQLTPLTSATPHLCYADNGVAIMGDYDETLGGNLQVAGGEVLSAYVLFDDDSNTSDNITLSDNMIYYDYIEIYCKEKTLSINGYTKVSNPNNKYVTLNIQKMTNSGGYMTHYLSRYYLVGTTISLYRNGHYNIVNNTVADCGVSDTNAEILITKVIGYKK